MEKSAKIMFSSKSDIQKKNKPPAGKLGTEVRTGDAPKPSFSMKTCDKAKKSGNQPPVSHNIFSLFLSLGQGDKKGTPAPQEENELNPPNQKML